MDHADSMVDVIAVKKSDVLIGYQDVLLADGTNAIANTGSVYVALIILSSLGVKEVVALTH